MGFAYLWLSIQAGWIKLPLPYPAVEQYAHPVPAHVYPWKAQPLDKGKYQVRTKLNATRLFEGQISGSESVTMAPDGRFIMLDRYGAVREALQQDDGSMVLRPTAIAHLGPGRPLGAQYDAHGNLIICDAFKGLIMLEAGTNKVVILANRVSASSPMYPNSPLSYTNDLDIAPDGTIYFTDSVDVHPHRNAQHNNNVTHIISIVGKPGYYDTVKGWALGMLQGLPKGRLLAYYPHNRTTHVISHEFYYSNGVAVSADGTYAAVCETDRLRVLKVWLPPHPRAGFSEVLIDGLPGTPDGISRSQDGNAFWVALVSNIPPITKWFGSALVRGILGHIPENMRPQVPTWGAVLKVSEQGKLLQWLADLKGETASKVPSAHEAGGRLYFGNLGGEYEDRETLRDQLRAAPAEGDPNDMAINIAKLRDLEARLLEEREEKAALAGEKAALAARLARLKESGADELREKAELQEALVRAEEQRLEVSRALIDFQMEANEDKQAWANTKFQLEQRILELESGRLEHHVRAEDHAALKDERDRLAGQLRMAADSEARLQRQLEAEKEQSSAQQAEVRRLNQLLAALEAAAAGDASALLVDTDTDDFQDSSSANGASAAAAYGNSSGARSASAVAAAIRSRQAAAAASSAAGGSSSSSKVSLTEVRLQLQRQLKQQERRSAELESQLGELQQQLEAAQAARAASQEAADTARRLLKRKMEAAAREVAELAQRVALAAG
ncbi:hypothetical protein OEZ85_006107 [Tetradesmus obliquus]|uniref:Strictosidine synthase conserved region domain-containing protein n=1 Tax=Tetradesmus obliquus TaxID=3088 RepID=A0ABY8UFM0_TETOB|nr:hypothetical protein OEZ85_006107 [Tetradesmus obliquus]